MNRKRLEREFGHLDIFEDAMKVLEGIENGTIKPRIKDFTGEWPELEQGELLVMWREEE